MVLPSVRFGNQAVNRLTDQVLTPKFQSSAKPADTVMLHDGLQIEARDIEAVRQALFIVKKDSAITALRRLLSKTQYDTVKLTHNYSLSTKELSKSDLRALSEWYPGHPKAIIQRKKLSKWQNFWDPQYTINGLTIRILQAYLPEEKSGCYPWQEKQQARQYA